MYRYSFPSVFVFSIDSLCMYSSPYQVKVKAMSNRHPPNDLLIIVLVAIMSIKMNSFDEPFALSVSTPTRTTGNFERRSSSSILHTSPLNSLKIGYLSR